MPKPSGAVILSVYLPVLRPKSYGYPYKGGAPHTLVGMRRTYDFVSQTPFPERAVSSLRRAYTYLTAFLTS